MPFSVEKIRRSFNAVAYTPNHDLSVEAKYTLTKEDAYTNDHERDALSAARAAYQFWNHRFAGIARRIPEGTDLDEVYAGIIRGLSVEQILHGEKAKKQPTTQEGSYKTETDPIDGELEGSRELIERIRILEGVVKDLRMHIQSAQEETTRKEREISELKERLKAMHDSRHLTLQRNLEINKREAIIKSLKKRLRNEERNNKKLYKRLKRLLEPSEEDTSYIRCGVISDLSKELVKQYFESPGWEDGLDNRIVYIHTIASWSRAVITGLQEMGVSVLVYGGSANIDPRLLDACCDLSLPLIKCGEFPKLRIKIEISQGKLREDILAIALREWEKTEQHYHAAKKNQEIEDLFTSYKAERELEVRKMK
jgi:predicted RNase H-like nuclease (RuvC/YqgF family)